MKTVSIHFRLIPATCILLSCGEDSVTLHSTFTDSRNHKTYEVIWAGSAKWMAEDLELNDSLFFSYQQSLSLCPPGWSLPSKNDWLDLRNFFGGHIYDGQSFGNPLQAYHRMVNEFNTTDYEYFWSATPPGQMPFHTVHGARAE